MKSMNIQIGNASIIAHDLRLDTGLEILLFQIDADQITLEQGKLEGISADEARLTLIITEFALNSCFHNAPLEGVNDFEIKMLSDRMEVCGKQALIGKLGLPFKLRGKIVTSEGRTFRLSLTEAEIAHSISLPEFMVNTIGERINANIASHFDIKLLPVPAELTSITIEPGRMILKAKILNSKVLTGEVRQITAS